MLTCVNCTAVASVEVHTSMGQLRGSLSTSFHHGLQRGAGLHQAKAIT